MKILLFTLEYPPFFGGVANVYGNLAKYWPADSGDEIFILDNREGRLIHGRWPVLKWLPAVWHLMREIRAKEIDLVMVGQILPLGTAALAASFFLKIPYVVFLHGMDFDFALKTKRKRCLAEKILRKAKKIICFNSYVRKLLLESGLEAGDLAAKSAVVSPGIETEDSQRGVAADLLAGLRGRHGLVGRPLLFSVGRLVKRKGFDRVIEAMPQIAERIPRIVYAIAGAGPDEDCLKEKISVLPVEIQARVRLVGKVSDEEKWAWLELCDVFIMPSRNIGGDYDGFGVVYLEANIKGKPVIAGESGGVGDAVEDGVNGLLANPEEVADIAEKVVRLFQDEFLRKRLGEEGKKRALKSFGWPGQAKKIKNKISL